MQIASNKNNSINLPSNYKKSPKISKDNKRLGSLNKDSRRLENVRISRENEQLFRRIGNQKAHIDRYQLESDYNFHLYHKKRLRKMEEGNNDSKNGGRLNYYYFIVNIMLTIFLRA